MGDPIFLGRLWSVRESCPRIWTSYLAKCWYGGTYHVVHGSVCGSGLSGFQVVAVPRPASDEQRIEVTAAGHLNPAGVVR
jgi:hypothetical protein